MHRYGLFTAALTLTLAACGSSGTGNVPLPANTNATAKTYSNVFAYCQALGTTDHPDNRYTGPQPPPEVIAGLLRALGIPPITQPSRAFLGGIRWRCMGSQVYACSVGANLPCESPADTERQPTPGEQEFCAAHPNSGFIPMYITGHNTIYAWRCHGTQALTGRIVSKVDARGYISNIWHLVPPSAPSGS